MPTIAVDDFGAVTLGLAVFLAGYYLNKRVPLLANMNIPEPVSGGLSAAVLFWLYYIATDTVFDFSMDIRDMLLVVFFTAIG